MQVSVRQILMIHGEVAAGRLDGAGAPVVVAVISVRLRAHWAVTAFSQEGDSCFQIVQGQLRQVKQTSHLNSKSLLRCGFAHLGPISPSFARWRSSSPLPLPRWPSIRWPATARPGRRSALGSGVMAPGSNVELGTDGADGDPW